MPKPAILLVGLVLTFFVVDSQVNAQVLKYGEPMKDDGNFYSAVQGRGHNYQEFNDQFRNTERKLIQSLREVVRLSLVSGDRILEGVISKNRRLNAEDIRNIRIVVQLLKKAEFYSKYSREIENLLYSHYRRNAGNQPNQSRHL